MNSHPIHPRRRVIAALGALALTGPGTRVASAQSPVAGRAPIATRRIPSSGEAMPVIGLGTWITFNVGNDPLARATSTEVMRAFLAGGGRMIDSSPMYGSSQEVIGQGLAQLGRPSSVFSADKVWIGAGGRGYAQIDSSRKRWGVTRFDLVQVHNLLAWEEQLPLLFAMKAKGEIRYVGITTSEGRRHREVESIMAKHPLDFVQLSYNLLDREAEARLLPLARERGIGVIVNRPFRQGALLRDLERHPLPAWAAAIDCDSWAQVALKFAATHPAVTCVIPATRQVAHVRENLAAGHGRQPDEAMRKRMSAYVEQL